MIGTGLAGKLGLGVGDRITLVSPQGRTTVFGTVPRLRAYRVVALFEAGMNEYDSAYVFLPLARGAGLLPDCATPRPRSRSSSQDPDPRARASTAEIARRCAAAPVRIVDWQDANSSFFTAVQVERNVMFLILTLIIMVAAFNIVSSPDHAGEGQGAGHRDPAHHGRHARRDPAHLPARAAPPSAWRAR